ncbi:BTB/POZ domain-containing protein [Sporothrix brasiliensis 5110]|uniref:BTB/POZ domain-containing protein n=1 Tax=Sporothrix brasiliensis 5110 TaxID=1398154 RepID=A0A0C2JBI5_9PEZI|nr:BTB/POZ domain-containing protein [Sporothrix brasiliensis 5110]KIH94227.1 BTB/POZ domain-containing protein [Sporothrix brasiliensis 5110]
MSQLWSCYIADNVERFRRLLALTGHSAQAAAVWNANAGAASGGGSAGGGGGGPSGSGDAGSSPHGTSPRAPAGKPRKASGFGAGFGPAKAGAGGGGTIGKAEINSRDHAGLTLLLRAAASTSETGILFVEALLEHPAIDIYVQDPESGWNALHRALYAGNISIARLLLLKERKDIAGQTLGAPVGRIGQLIKTKDHEGNSPFDLYNSIIGERRLAALDNTAAPDGDDSDDDDHAIQQNHPTGCANLQALVDGEDLFFFGSNKNLTLGMGDGDDRQFPERVYLKRPDHLVRRFYEEHLEETKQLDPTDISPSPTDGIDNIPALIQGRPLLIHDVVLSKLHSAILTADPVSNLYMCGIGRGGRLGLGDENTRFSFEPVQGPLTDRKIVQVALGQNHSMAVTDNGELWTWGANTFSQLGYALPPSPKRDQDPMTATPRQVFGPLRKEAILGVAASALHSVAHTGSSLYCWGKNVGQLALMDADSRSLDVQTVPRKVAASLFSSPIVSVSAIDKATTCLLANHTVCVFTSYGYKIVKFPFTETFGHRLGNFNMSSRYDAGRNQINYIASGGETIAAVTSRGDLFTMSLTNLAESSQSATSTTNPSKIRDALTTPQCIWNAHKDGVRSVDVGEQGSVIICSHSGAVWRRIKRAKAKDAHVSGGGAIKNQKKKDYKFQRVPYITNVTTVRSSAFGAFAAIRRDSDVIKEQIGVEEQSLWEDVRPLMAISDFTSTEPDTKDADKLKFWDATSLQERLGPVAYQILRAIDLERDLTDHLANWEFEHRGSPAPGVLVCTSQSPEIRIPVHSWIVSARSSVLRDALAQCRHGDGTFELAEVLSIQTKQTDGGDSVAVITFQGLDLLSLLNLVLYMYEDKVIPVWNYARQAQPLAHRYRHVRTEVMKAATRLNMLQLEAAVRIQTEPKQTMHDDFRVAMQDSRFFEDGDAILELNGAELPVHSVFLCQRCPWFEGLFHGRSGGQWLANRRQTSTQSVTKSKIRLDLKHMDPKAFQFVLQYLYADVGPELFDGLVSPDLEAFFDAVLDVLSIANELMLDRLSQICQLVIGQFATTRNISHLLNTVSVCVVSEFKDAALEYICLQMETMLENHLLDDLDEELLQDLDAVVRDNQLAQMPFARSGRAMADLLHKYPELAQDMDEERQRRVREMAFKAAHRDDDRRTLSSSFKGRAGSVDDSSSGSLFMPAASPSAERARRKSRTNKNEQPMSPVLRPKASHADLMFSMEEDEATGGALAGTRPGSRSGPAVVRTDDGPDDGTAPVSLRDESGFGVSPSHSRPAVNANIAGSSPVSSFAPPTTPARRPGVLTKRGAAPPAPAPAPATMTPKTPAETGAKPWGSPAATPPTERLNIRSILTETVSAPFIDPRKSALSAGLKEQRPGLDDAPAVSLPRIAAPKMSQKERKKQQQQQQLLQQTQSLAKSLPKAPAWDKSAVQSSPSAAGPAKQPATTHLAPPPSTSPLATSGTSTPSGSGDPALGSLPKPRGKKPLHHSPRTASPDTRFAGQPRPSATGSSSSKPANAAPLAPHSKVYIKPAPKAEPVLGLTMADIFLQQQLEQETMKEAVAKRSLQEIQQEQAFQEWWDQESQRTQEEETRRQQSRGKSGSSGGGRSEGGRGREGRRGAKAADARQNTSAAASTSSRKHRPSTTNKAATRGEGTGGGGGGGGGRNQRGGRGGGDGLGQHHAEAAAGGEGGSSRRRGGGGGRGGKA